jgi:hypothetical protein
MAGRKRDRRPDRALRSLLLLLPLYIFCGRDLLAAKFRPANIDLAVPLAFTNPIAGMARSELR